MTALVPDGRLRSRLGDFTLTPRVLWIVAWAVPVGLLGAGAAWVLLRLIALITNLVFYQRLSTAMVSPGAGPHPWWLVLFAPVVGGLVVGLMARYGSEKIRGHGMPETIEAILTRRSRVEPSTTVLKPVSAAVSIGTGGPFGAEGPIIMTGGALGSLIAQGLRVSADERKALLVSGAAAGMSATFNAPMASVLLAVELLLFEWRPRSLLPVATAAVVAAGARVPLLGGEPLFGLNTGGWHLGVGIEALCVITGIVGGLLAIVVTSLVYASEDAFIRLRRIPWPWWPAIGGLIIGVGGLVEPRALGVGYDVIGDLLSGHAALGFVVGILVVKSLIWALSLGSGTSGGVLAPVFIIGAALGALEGHLLPDAGAGFWALAGLAAVVGGVMRCPLTGVVFSLELTHAWPALVPLLIASFAAYGTSALLLRRSVLTEKIARRGLHLSREYDVDPLEVLFVDEVMDVEPATVDVEASPVDARALRRAETARRGRARASVDGSFEEGSGPSPRQRLFPVLDGDRLVGVVTATILDGPVPSVRESMIDDGVVVVGADDTLASVRARFATGAVTSAPVVDDAGHLVGLITAEHLLDGRLPDLAEEHHRARGFGRKAAAVRQP